MSSAPRCLRIVERARVERELLPGGIWARRPRAQKPDSRKTHRDNIPERTDNLQTQHGSNRQRSPWREVQRDETDSPYAPSIGPYENFSPQERVRRKEMAELPAFPPTQQSQGSCCHFPYLPPE